MTKKFYGCLRMLLIVRSFGKTCSPTYDSQFKMRKSFEKVFYRFPEVRQSEPPPPPPDPDAGHRAEITRISFHFSYREVVSQGIFQYLKFWAKL